MVSMNAGACEKVVGRRTTSFSPSTSQMLHSPSSCTTCSTIFCPALPRFPLPCFADEPAGTSTVRFPLGCV
jgi:hypothetical protein